MRKRKLNLTDRYMAGVVVYGGIAVRRSDMFAHLQACGVTGPAMLTYGSLPDVNEEPEQRWDTKAGDLVWIEDEAQAAA